MKERWIGVQYWENPIFMHWPVPYDTLRALVPAPFQLDTFNGQAWIGLILFRASRSSSRWGASLFSLGSLWQLNVRTYIRFNGKPAIYFLTVYTNSRLSVMGGNVLLSLPYKTAIFHSSSSGKKLSCSMVTRQTDEAPFHVHVRPSSEGFYASDHPLAHWLTERYHFDVVKGRRIVQASISHTPWYLHEAQGEIVLNGLVNGIPESAQPLVHIGESQTAYLHPFESIGRYRK